ncbi:hypothetical protein DI53_2874 [Sphingobacterium deserti]|uniref:Uncharacterized protein n=1 Tax=Sphingobacterium deserti TaxID=1229276 RepID=A0A0B8T312_9SPHI|nr:hypothetical protein DI53_2874 [Sphingobacterium deserti]
MRFLYKNQFLNTNIELVLFLNASKSAVSDVRVRELPRKLSWSNSITFIPGGIRNDKMF